MDVKDCVVLFAPSISRTAGGISNTAYYLAKELSKEYDVSVFTSSNNNEQISNVQIFTNKENKTIRSFIKNFVQFKKLCAVKSDRKITTVSLSWRNAIVSHFLKKRFNYHDIILCHGNELIEKRSLKNHLENKLRNKIFRNASQICANSNYTKGLVKKIVPNKNIMVVHPCQGETIHKDSIDNRYILSVGRLEKRKGFQDVIAAIELLQSSFPDIKYYIAGSGEYKDELQQAITQKELEENCFLLDKVSEEKKRELISGCSLLIMPSFFDRKASSVEGFGIVFLEANAYGKPVIGTYSGGIPDAIKDGETGILVHQHDVKGIALAIESILNGSFVVDKESCYNWAEQHSYENIAKQYSDIISIISK